MGQLVFARRLHGGYGAGFGGSGFNQLLGAAFRAVADVEMIPDQQQKRRRTGEFPRTPNRVAIAERLDLLHECETLTMWPGGGAIGLPITRVDDDTNLLDAGLKRFFNDDGQGGFTFSVAIHQGLEGQGTLILSGGSDEALAVAKSVLMSVFNSGSFARNL